uniref:Uncharacterized protein n=1 Tax=Ditylenchus dipsaci TaxID=166011 RepID=A0A915DQB8_9BILA
MSLLSSATTSNTPASNFLQQSSFSSRNPPDPHHSSNPALFLDHEDSEKEADHLEDSLRLGICAEPDKEALIVDKKQKAKKRFQFTSTRKDKNKDCFVELKEDFSTKDPPSLPLVSRTNCSFEREQVESSSKYPYLSSVYYDALEEPGSVGELAVHHPLSQQGVEQQQQPKTNSPASSPAALNSTSSATKQTCVAAAGSVAGGVPGEPTAHSTPNKPTLSSAAMVRRLTGAARKRHQAQHVSAANQHQSTSSSSTTGRSSLQATGEALHLVNSNTNPRNSRHQPVQARHNQHAAFSLLLLLAVQGQYISNKGRFDSTFTHRIGTAEYHYQMHLSLSTLI